MDEMIVAHEREMIQQLKELHNTVLKNGEGLDQKSWNILTFGSSTFAVVAVLQALLVQKEGASLWFWLGLLVVLLCYGGMVRAIMKVIHPALYTYPLVLPGPERSIEQWDATYISANDDSMLRQLISNLAGDGHTTGAIQDAEAINQIKAHHLNRAAIMLALTIVGLVGLAAIAVIT